jgi:glutamate N-acetyltransferase/amino-acid N-acetyltransferase
MNMNYKQSLYIVCRDGASKYLREAGENHSVVRILVSIGMYILALEIHSSIYYILVTNGISFILLSGSGAGSSTAWGCDLSYDYVKINAEYTT